MRRNQLAFAAMAGVGAALLLGAVVSTVLLVKEPGVRQKAEDHHRAGLAVSSTATRAVVSSYSKRNWPRRDQVTGYAACRSRTAPRSR